MKALVISHLLMFTLMFVFMGSDPYILRHAHVYGSIAIGIASGLASLASFSSKIATALRGLKSEVGIILSSSLILIASPLPLLGYYGFIAYMIITNIAFAITVVSTLIVVAEAASPDKLGFHYALRGVLMSIGGIAGPFVGAYLYSSMGLVGIALFQASSALVMLSMALELKGFGVKASSGLGFSKGWTLAYLTSIFLASSFMIISTYLPPYQASLGISLGATSSYFSSRALGSLMGRFPGGIMFDKGLAIFFLPSLVMLMASLLAPQALTLSYSALVGFLVGFSWGIASPMLLSLATLESEKGKSMSLFVTSWDVASMTIVPLAGSLGSYSKSLQSAVATSLAALALSLPLSLHARRYLASRGTR